MTGTTRSSFVEPATVAAVKSGDLSGITLDRPRVIVDVSLLLRDGDRILLGRRSGSGFAGGLYSLPAGHLELGETVVDSLIREAREELGITIAPGDVAFVQVMHNAFGLGRLAFFFEVRTWSGEVTNTEPGKCDHLRWFDLTDLPADMVPYIREAIGTYSAGGQASLTFYGW
jgi:mutator protein MutT